MNPAPDPVPRPAPGTILAYGEAFGPTVSLQPRRPRWWQLRRRRVVVHGPLLPALRFVVAPGDVVSVTMACPWFTGLAVLEVDGDAVDNLRRDTPGPLRLRAVVPLAAGSHVASVRVSPTSAWVHLPVTPSTMLVEVAE